eukprot:SAG22_NODE_363_length_11694_cov_40.815783_12_plen_121_part_00
MPGYHLGMCLVSVFDYCSGSESEEWSNMDIMSFILVIFKLFLLFILCSLEDFLAFDNLIVIVGLADHRRLRRLSVVPVLTTATPSELLWIASRESGLAVLESVEIIVRLVCEVGELIGLV